MKEKEKEEEEKELKEVKKVEERMRQQAVKKKTLRRQDGKVGDLGLFTSHLP